MTDTELALVRGVCAEPKNDTPRLAYADYLDETATTLPCEECDGTGWVRPGVERCGECEGTIGSGRGRPRPPAVPAGLRHPALVAPVAGLPVRGPGLGRGDRGGRRDRRVLT